MKKQFFMTGILALAGLAPCAAWAEPAPGPAAARSVASRLEGVQHFGVTVSNLDRAYKFYTEVMGGTEVMRDGDFEGESIQNTLMQVDELEAKANHVNPQSVGVPNLRSGDQRLDVVFIRFDNVVIELLQYRDQTQKAWTEGTYNQAHGNNSPAFPTNMHISFQVNENVDFDQFIADLEKAAHERGMDNVRCNRNVPVADEAGRLAAPVSSNALEITEGKSNGWALTYCKGPEGEQLEFNQVKDPVKGLFEAARQRHLARKAAQ